MLCAPHDILSEVQVKQDLSFSVSPHLPVTATLLASTSHTPEQSTVPKSAGHKPIWKKCDDAVLTETIREVFPEITPDQNDHASIEAYCLTVMDALKYGAEQAGPCRRDRGPSPQPWSPDVATAMRLNKQALHRWIAEGRPPEPHPAACARKDAKKQLRRAFRTASAKKRLQLYQDIMDASASDTRLFHRLIKTQRGTSNQNNTQLIVCGKLITSPDDLLDEWTKHFSRLATPSINPSFDTAYQQLVLEDIQAIQYICSNSGTQPEPITEHEIIKAVNKLHMGKAADIYQLSAEHLKHALPAVLPFLLQLLNSVMGSGHLPPALQQGYIIPIHKKGRDPLSTDNYRGITITPILSKLLEHILLSRVESAFAQQDLQYGFTKGMAPAFASLIVTEALAEARDRKTPLYLVTLDVKKAFDVVDHASLMRKLYSPDADPNTWTIMKQNLESNSQVRLQGRFGKPFPVRQGVGQGKILSTHNYKVYANGLLVDLSTSKLGLMIGGLYIGCPVCADDVILLSFCPREIKGQVQTTVAYSRRERYEVHPVKTQYIGFGAAETVDLKIGDDPITNVDSFQHLGITRSKGYRGQLSLDTTIDDRVSLARRTSYALMGAGLHGYNGISPTVSTSIYRVYVVTRLLYGLETLVLLAKHVKQLNEYHRATLKVLQSLPPNTATAAVHLLIGIPPAEAYLDCAIAALLAGIARNQDNVIYDLANNQLAMKTSTSASWFVYAARRLQRYHISIDDILDGSLQPKSAKNRIIQHWENELKLEAIEKSSLKHLNIAACSLHHPHELWTCSQYSLSRQRRSITRIKLVTGTYILQMNRSAHNQYQVDPTCLLCGKAPEDLPHFLLHCDTLAAVRLTYQDHMETLVPGYRCLSEYSRIQLILDHRLLGFKLSRSTDSCLHRLAEALCFNLHAHRTKHLNEINATRAPTSQEGRR